MMRIIFFMGILGCFASSCSASSLVAFTADNFKSWGIPYYNGTVTVISVDMDDETPNPCAAPNFVYSKCDLITLGAYDNDVRMATLYSRINTIGTSGIRVDKQVASVKTLGEVMRIYFGTTGIVGKPLKVAASGVYYCDYLGPASQYCILKRRSFGDLCVVLGYTLRDTSSGSGNEGFIPFAGANCITPTDPGNQCDIEGQAVIDHGTLSDESVDGHRATQTLRVSCAKPTSAMVYLQNNNGSGKIKLRPDGSLYSSLAVNGNNGVNGTQVTIPSGGANIVFDSTLSKVGDLAPGPFEGSAVAIVNFL
jgi:hypothetical protein